MLLQPPLNIRQSLAHMFRNLSGLQNFLFHLGSGTAVFKARQLTDSLGLLLVAANGLRRPALRRQLDDRGRLVAEFSADRAARQRQHHAGCEVEPDQDADIGKPAARAPLAGDTAADVCIVGAGYTGLWTAYYLKQANPALRVVVVEKEFAGFGASGRNGAVAREGVRRFLRGESAAVPAPRASVASV